MLLFECALPFPPSVNGLFGGGSSQKRFPSKAYKDWIKSCPDGLIDKTISGKSLHIVYDFCFPDKRKRDLSNYIKAPEDWLVNQGVIEDDNWQIVGKVTICHSGVSKKGASVHILIYTLDN